MESHSRKKKKQKNSGGGEKEVHEKSPWAPRTCTGLKVYLHVSRGRVQPESAVWALSAHGCIDFKVISVIRLTCRAASHTMKCYFEIVWYRRGRLLAEVIFMFFSLLVAFSEFIFSAGVILFPWCIHPRDREPLCEKSLRYHNLWKCLHLFALGPVHLIMWWHFKVLVERWRFDTSGRPRCHDICRWQ